ncbi:CDP-diacylglycerol--glycerol-3-phosphate 3-phosphatidyltransferase [Feifania hominis]|uniref:CDP-diacylglycerol--glycerol-3-phosphate 3-phosphatidyltransferase n=1 Tax=Feifania hominis TaxID=2763660 RepID=A0A926HUE2_9FIRM|nr:CDP-diacylglycerol--glycerol-3-phosphate 3-phosphatidyltransferase [Feifania hominis]MBC8535461.1 CDP-diacylglycerol--glycerol-3-phosphate 3-phosphatidyltransferase [Feifania hominis]
MNLPNALSIFRLILVPVFLLAFFMPIENNYLVACFVFILSGITDYMDGYIARKYGQITDLGKLLDPLADKMMQTTVFFCLWSADIVPLWVFLIFLGKEVIQILLSSKLYNKENVVVQSNWYGKVATGVFYLVVFLILVLDLPPQWNLLLVFFALGWAVFAFVMYGVAYRGVLKAEFDRMRGKNRQQKEQKD